MCRWRATGRLRVSAAAPAPRRLGDNTYDVRPHAGSRGLQRHRAARAALYAPTSSSARCSTCTHRDLNGSARLFRANIIKPGTNDLVDGFDPIEGGLRRRQRSGLTQNTGGSARLRWSTWAAWPVLDHRLRDREDLQPRRHRRRLRRQLPARMGPGFIPFPVETADGMPDHRQSPRSSAWNPPRGGPLGWQAGVYLFDEDYTSSRAGYDSTAGNVDHQYQRVRQKNNAYAVFGASTTQSPAS
jgi:iron complex outermembrane receptor protein